MLLSNKDSDNDDSLTDVSILIQKNSSSINNNQIPNNTIYDPFFQSLIDYANSLNLDETIYSIYNQKNQFNEISLNNKTIIQLDSTKFIPSHFYSLKTIDDYNSDENTTITDGSKFQWEYLSDTKDYSKNSQIKINLENSSSPIIIYEKTKDHLLPVFRSPTPIIVREILHKPSLPKYSSSASNTLSQRSRLSKPPIIPKRQINNEQISSNSHFSNQQTKKIIIEYDQINIKVDKNIKQRKEIKCVNPNEYTQQYGSSLYSKEIFHNLYTTIVS